MLQSMGSQRVKNDLATEQGTIGTPSNGTIIHIVGVLEGKERGKGAERMYLKKEWLKTAQI